MAITWAPPPPANDVDWTNNGVAVTWYSASDIATVVYWTDQTPAASIAWTDPDA